MFIEGPLHVTDFKLIVNLQVLAVCQKCVSNVLEKSFQLPLPRNSAENTKWKQIMNDEGLDLMALGANGYDKGSFKNQMAFIL